jgi:hypothetical protein
MPQWLSRTIVAFLALPIAYFTVWFLFLCVHLGLALIEEPSAGLALISLTYLLTLGAIAVGWILMARFVRMGIVGLSGAGRRPWWIATSGGPVTLAALIALRFEWISKMRFTSDFVWGLQFLQIGTLYVATLIYLAVDGAVRGRKLTMHSSGP